MIKIKRNELTNPRDIVDDLTRSPDFLARRGSLKPELGRKGFELALSQTARAAADKSMAQHGGFETMESLQQRLIGMMPEFVVAQDVLDSGAYIDQNRKRKLLRTTVEYNHIIGELIERMPEGSLSGLLSFIQRGALLALANPASAQRLSNRTHFIASGQRHEVASEAALWLVEGVSDVQKPTFLQELSHIDRVVTYGGEEWGLDIKSNDRSARLMNTKITDPRIRAVWSGFTDAEFGDKLSLPQNIIEREAPFYEEQLEDMLTASSNAKKVI